MDKTDVIYGVAAIVIILIMALVVKPVLTGQPVNTGIPRATTQVTAPTATPAAVIATTPLAATPVPTTVPATTAQPTPTWDKKVQTVAFVNSSTYGVSLTEAIPNGTRIDNVALNTSMVSFAKITGKSSGTTQIITIPFPYWELVYTVDPVAETKPSSVTVTPAKGSGVSAGSGVQGSYSSAMPDFTIQIMDAGDPNRIVRTISPPGGIDLALWTGAKRSINPASTAKAGRITNPPEVPVTDPRPWTEKIYEGQRSYYFIITAHLLNSYSIDIRVPSRYLNST